MRALVVDDSAATRAILQRALGERGFEVMAAASGRDALLRMRQHDLDLVLIAWSLAGMTGFELLRAIRRQSRYDRTKLVMVTAASRPEEMVHALAAGADECIPKPFTPDVVYAALRHVGVPVAHAESIVCA